LNAVVKDLRYVQERDWFSGFAFQVFREYFPDRSAFDTFVDSIAADEEKSGFLKVASFYKFLVKDGRFSVPEYEETKYFDETFRFLAICALIEWAEPRQRIEGFYGWLRKSLAAFPIQGPEDLKALHEQYKSQSRLVTKMVSFFRRLDAASKRELESSIKVHGQPMPIDEVVTTLYGLRSKFMHDARLIVDLSGTKTWSARHPGREITLPLKRLERFFERAVLLRFGYPAPASWPKG
jgi:hypothetical protein